MDKNKINDDEKNRQIDLFNRWNPVTRKSDKNCWRGSDADKGRVFTKSGKRKLRSMPRTVRTPDMGNACDYEMDELDVSAKIKIP